MSETEGRTGLTPETLAAYLTVVHRFAMVASPRGIEPEDVAQEAMVRILEHIDRFDERLGSLDGWMWRIVLNLARDAERAARRKHVLAGRLAARDRTVAAERSPESIVLDRVRDRDLLTAVRCLPRRYRVLIGLRYGAGLRSEEIAAVLGATRMAVVKATRRALDRLRSQLSEMEVVE